MSADATRLVAGNAVAGAAYFSTNSGKSWTKANGPERNWYGLASSADGLRVAAIDFAGQEVVTSTNGGRDWQTNSPVVKASWDSIACSADGLDLIVAAGGVGGSLTGGVYTSRNAGRSWSSNSLPAGAWRAVTSSADGQILLAAIGGLQRGSIYISTNAGDSWALTSAPVTNWQAVAISADGATLAALARVAATPVFTSTNLGLSWRSHILPRALWSDLALSADGAKIFASGDQNIFTLQTTAQPRLNLGMVDGHLSLSWVISSSPVTLQRSSDLSAAQWTDIPVNPITDLTNLRDQVTVPSVQGTAFYRLRATQ
jgi:hypothetical protein